MIESPLKSYGFEYKYNDHSFAFDVMAQSETEAKQRVAHINSSVFIGELKQEQIKHGETENKCQ
jgi:hypothetical protein